MMVPKFRHMQGAAVAAVVTCMVATVVIPQVTYGTEPQEPEPASAPTRHAWVTIRRTPSQSLTVSADAAPAPVARDAYSVTAPKPKPKPTAGPSPAASPSPGTTVTAGGDVLVSGADDQGVKYSYDATSAGPVGWPFPDGAPVTSVFGARHVQDCAFCSTFHDGVDFAPSAGTPIHAIAGGVVKVAGTYFGYGNAVVIDSTVNGVTFETTYGHLADNSITVKVGDTVTYSDAIGKVGSTGNSTGPHLHLGISANGAWVDPLAWIPEQIAGEQPGVKGQPAVVAAPVPATQ
ncbi:M23 family metallopeptidase [Curtobacterium sp. MCBD17_040]|uniref:M23 family metallopeptidase n=1 Tax=Curtobacterium sp. MCBD17_040 TaxID=2175674 RepID=UPI000DAA7F49|nr:M23 family metallopeptidase [Curtobacterium sp. MCBD17_040]WIB65834.1 peptidoglycan DD-metalloendopeptidase family protein [Curtobacterium sp. MCBD17_040]